MEYSLPSVNKDEERNDLAEFVGGIIDIMEDTLEEYKVEIQNEEKGDPEDPEDPENPAIIYGSDYDFIADRIKEEMGKQEKLWIDSSKCFTSLCWDIQEAASEALKSLIDKAAREGRLIMDSGRSKHSLIWNIISVKVIHYIMLWPLEND